MYIPIISFFLLVFLIIIFIPFSVNQNKIFEEQKINFVLLFVRFYGYVLRNFII
jgi:hypothetical protein